MVFEHKEAGQILKSLIKLMPESDVIITFSGKTKRGGTFSFANMVLILGDCRIGNGGLRVEITATANSGTKKTMVWLANGEKGRKRVKADSIQLKITGLVISNSKTAGLINQLFQDTLKVEA